MEQAVAKLEPTTELHLVTLWRERTQSRELRSVAILAILVGGVGVVLQSIPFLE